MLKVFMGVFEWPLAMVRVYSIGLDIVEEVLPLRVQCQVYIGNHAECFADVLLICERFD